MICALDHLLDDSTVGGVTRLLEHLSTDPAVQRYSRHRIHRLQRGRLTAPTLKCDVIVSNMVASWRNLPFFLALRAANPRTPIVHVEHSYCESFVALNVGDRDRFETLLRTVYSLVDAVVAVSEEQRRWMARKEFCRPAKLRVIEPCADLAPFARLPARGDGPARIVGALGRFETQKGFDILIDSFRLGPLAGHELHLWGGGGEEAALRARAAGLSNVVFRGFADSPADALSGCDLVAMPSRWEPCGIVPFEAMAAGRPVLCSTVDGLRDHSRNGALSVAENTPEQWAARIASLDPDEIARAVSAGRTRAAQAQERLVSGWRDLVAELTAGGNTGSRRAA